jgi:hypothetical protein
MKININIKGNNNKNQEIPGKPALQIKFKIHVQNKTYKSLIANITNIFGT